MKTRFKTKQEINSTLSKSEQDCFWCRSKDYLFGLPWGGQNKSDGPISLYPELTNGGSYWNVSPEIFTTSPHPYKEKSFKIKVTPKESEMVQKKAFALGYVSHTDKSEIHYGCTELYFYSNKCYAWMKGGGGEYFNQHPNIELTPQQFLDGDLPEKTQFEKDVDRMSKYYTLGVDPCDSAGAGEAKKTDAYIDKQGGIHIMSDDGGIMRLNSVQSICDRLYEYNLMSEENFKKKHTPSLKFKQWDVKSDKNFIKVGCVKVEREHVNSFCQIMRLLMKHDIGPGDMYSFLNSNREELDLNFSPHPNP